MERVEDRLAILQRFQPPRQVRDARAAFVWHEPTVTEGGFDEP
jgi:hypothetical protein